MSNDTTSTRESLIAQGYRVSADSAIPPRFGWTHNTGTGLIKRYADCQNFETEEQAWQSALADHQSSMDLPTEDESVGLEDLLKPLRAALDTCHDTDWSLRQFKPHIMRMIAALGESSHFPARAGHGHAAAIDQLKTAAATFENAASVPNAPNADDYAQKAREIRTSIAALSAGTPAIATPAMPRLSRGQIIDIISPLSENSADHDIEFANRVIDALAILQAKSAEVLDAEIDLIWRQHHVLNEAFGEVMDAQAFEHAARAILALRQHAVPMTKGQVKQAVRFFSASTPRDVDDWIESIIRYAEEFHRITVPGRAEG